MPQIIRQRGTGPRATSCRNTGRHHLGMSGRLHRNPQLDKLSDGLHPDVAASYALTRLVQRLIELQPLLLDMIVTHGLVDLGELVASLPLNALVERRKLAKRTRET